MGVAMVRDGNLKKLEPICIQVGYNSQVATQRKVNLLGTTAFALWFRRTKGLEEKFTIRETDAKHMCMLLYSAVLAATGHSIGVTNIVNTCLRNSY